MRALDERRPLPAREGGSPARRVEWLGPVVAPWGSVSVDGRQLDGGFPVTVTGAVTGSALAVGQSRALYPLLARSDVTELWGGGGAATLTLSTLPPLRGMRVLGSAMTDRGLLTLLGNPTPNAEPSILDVQEAHAAARAAGGGIVLALEFPFARVQEQAEAPDALTLGEYAVAGVGGLLLGLVVARYW